MDSQLEDALKTEYENITNIDSLQCIFGLSFPDSITAFQMAFLTLAPLMATCRDMVLKGNDIPHKICADIKMLADIIYDGKEKQR